MRGVAPQPPVARPPPAYQTFGDREHPLGRAASVRDGFVAPLLPVRRR